MSNSDSNSIHISVGQRHFLDMAFRELLSRMTNISEEIKRRAILVELQKLGITPGNPNDPTQVGLDYLNTIDPPPQEPAPLPFEQMKAEENEASRSEREKQKHEAEMRPLQEPDAEQQAEAWKHFVETGEIKPDTDTA